MTVDFTVRAVENGIIPESAFGRRLRGRLAAKNHLLGKRKPFVDYILHDGCPRRPAKNPVDIVPADKKAGGQLLKGNRFTDMFIQISDHFQRSLAGPVPVRHDVFRGPAHIQNLDEKRLHKGAYRHVLHIRRKSGTGDQIFEIRAHLKSLRVLIIKVHFVSV